MLAMLSWYRRLLPREDKFFDLFEAHSRILVGGAVALERLLQGDDIDARCAEIMRLEDEADAITQEVMLAVRRSFITPFDRNDIKDLIQSMDDAIDMMRKTVKTVMLFDQRSFEPLMQQMGGLVVEAAQLTSEAVPLLKNVNANVTRLSELAERIVRAEDESDDLQEKGLKDLFHSCGNAEPMRFIIGSEIYGELEKVVDRFEDVANEISGIVIENV
jgi:predicted phosphate transport protein (TIGR00153 family)